MKHGLHLYFRRSRQAAWFSPALRDGGKKPALSLLVFLFVLAFLPRAYAQMPPPNLVNPAPLPAPPWLDGYQIRWPVRLHGEIAKSTSQSVLVSLPTGGWLKPDAADLAVHTAEGKPLPHIVLSHDPAGETIIQFKRNGNDPWYWVYGINPKAPPRPAPKPEPMFQEGVSLELREWAGDDISSWAKVRPGLDKSTKVIGNAIVGEVLQKTNPARPSQPRKFAASFRGFLDVKKPGIYRFLINADDASFLFIDGFKVFERAGSNARLGTIKLKELDKIAGKVDLKAGIHPFEVHNVVGANPEAQGVCALLWSPPGEAKFKYLLSKEMKPPLYARVAAMDRQAGQSAATFAFGMDDTLESNGLRIFLARFEAQGNIKEGEKVIWDFGDGTFGTGRSVRHVYFKEGDYAVTVQGGAGLPPYRRMIHIWAEPGETSPLSLELAVKLIEDMDWKKLGVARIREVFAFLSICEQPNRWSLLDKVGEFLLAQKEENLDFRSQLYASRVEALAHVGKAVEGLKLAEKARPEFAKTPALHVRIQLAVAAVHQYHLKDAAAASKIYKAVIDEHSRTEHPFLRLAGIRWGDLFAESGDLVRAADTYRMAASLGGEKFQSTALTDASTRGALLRIAEQKLKAGEIHATRQLLERVELNYPGQRLDGLYCFLRAEADRFAGRYEDSQRHYEMILKLPQWASYRDRALFGIADCYFRMEDLDKAKTWIGNIKEAFPKFYEKQKVGDVEKLIESRLDRIKKAKEDGNPESAFFKGWSTGFEPDEPEPFGTPNQFVVVAAPGMQGPHAAMIDVFPQESAMLTYDKKLKNLTGGATYFVEIWYKDVFRPQPPAPVSQQGYINLYLSADKLPDVIVAANMHHNTFHWHKLSFKVKAPLAQDFTMKLYFYNQTGVILYDGLTVRPVSDRQVDSLISFYEVSKGS